MRKTPYMSDQSLERALDDNTKAVLELTDAIAAIVKSAPATRSRKVAADKDGDAPRGPGRPRNPPKDKSDKEPTLDEIHRAFGAYLAVKDEDEYDKRADFIKSMSDEFGVSRLSEASDADFRQAHKWLEAHIAGERVNFGEDRITGGDGGRGRGRDDDRGNGRDRGDDRRASSRDDDRGRDDRGRDDRRDDDRGRDRDRGRDDDRGRRDRTPL